MSFLLDTGADGMAIRRSLADSIGLKVSHSQEASVVGGRKTVQISADNVLRLSDSLSLKSRILQFSRGCVTVRMASSG